MAVVVAVVVMTAAATEAAVAAVTKVVAEVAVAAEPDDALSVRSLPPVFEDRIRSFGAPEYSGLLEALASGKPVVAVRPNLGKGAVMSPDLRMVPWNPSARYMDQRPRFTFDPAFHQGLYYVQEPSSMIVGEIVGRLSAGLSAPVYLDACAAPGGKTTAAIDALPDDAIVLANEYVPARAAVLRDNVIKWGCPRVAVSQGDTSRLGKLSGVFDMIGADVPCSGEGMMRKDPEAVAQWSPALVAQCAALQRDIVANLWPALKPGGYLIYSTCTFNRQENEENVQWIIDEFGAVPVEISFPAEWGIVSSGCMHRFMPHRLEGEGLFVAVLRKPDDSELGKPMKLKSARTRKPDAVIAKASEWIDRKYDMELVQRGDRISAWSAAAAALLRGFEQCVNVIYSGVEVATVKGRDLLPSHSLALSTVLDAGAFPVADVDYGAAIAFLRREAVTLADAPRGIVLLRHGGRPLGFVKNLGNRANNLLPAELRILSGYVPQTPPHVVVAVQ